MVNAAERYVGRGRELADLRQAGNLGLMRAAEKSDWKKNVRFSPHAS